MNSIKRILFMAGLLLSQGGCTTRLKIYPYGMVNPAVSLEPLKRNQYVILGDVQGTAEETYLLGFIPLHSEGSLGVGGRIEKKFSEIQGQGLNGIEQKALYNALEKRPDADGVIAVRVVKATRTGFAFFYSTKYVVVKGKAIRIKTDVEAAPPAQEP